MLALIFWVFPGFSDKLRVFFLPDIVTRFGPGELLSVSLLSLNLYYNNREWIYEGGPSEMIFVTFPLFCFGLLVPGL